MEKNNQGNRRRKIKMMAVKKDELDLRVTDTKEAMSDFQEKQRKRASQGTLIVAENLIDKRGDRARDARLEMKDLQALKIRPEGKTKKSTGCCDLM
jgi:hypothetical protein